MNRFLLPAAFLAGLAVIGWVGAGYVGHHPLALAVTLIVAAFYLLGTLELHRFRQATATLQGALAELAQPPAGLSSWLERLHPSLRNAVRLRVEGDRVALPGPTLTPYLAGLLVLIGMLGTFLGMVVTLQGTGAALDSSTDLETIRSSLSAPVKGLGLAFGTSVAGVAASAALGLLSALSRRERLQAAQELDARIATTLRPYSQAHRREESFRLLQQQTEQQARLMPALVEQLQTMMASMAQQQQALTTSLAERQETLTTALARQQEALTASLAQQQGALTTSLAQQQGELHAQLAAGQAQFHSQAAAAYTGLATSIDRTLQSTLQTSLAEGARAAGAAIQPAVEATLAGLARETATLHANLTGTVEQQLGAYTSRIEATATAAAQAWQQALAEQQRTSRAQAGDLRTALDGFSAGFEQRATTLVEQLSGHLDKAVGGIGNRLDDSLAQITTRLDEAAGSVSQHWATALAQHEQAGERTAQDTRDALAAATAGFEQHAAALLRTVGEAHTELHTRMAEREAQRLATWTGELQAATASLREEWQQAGAHTARQQQQVCDTLERTAREVSAQTEAHAQATIAEIARLVQTASEAPRAAAEVVAELRQKLSDSMARDNTMLEERTRLLDTLGTLLDAVNHASTEQRRAIDALVATSADLLERVGGRFTEQVGQEASRMTEAAAQVAAGAAEVASLGEAFGAAVQIFGETGNRLTTQLQRVESALGQSMARSDEQLAYYVAQAREVIDLSLTSQQQIVQDLQQLAERRAALGEAA